MTKGDGKVHAGAELLNSVTLLAERSDRDGNATRVFFAGRSSKGGIIPAGDLLVVFVKPGGKRREYTRFTKEWPGKFEPAGKIMRSPRYLCSAIAGVLDGTLYVGTDEVRWSPVKPGESRKPVAADSEGCACGCTRHDLHERDIRKVGALNPVRMVRHRLLLMLGKSAYDPKVCGEELEIQDQLQFPRFLTSVNLPYQRFKVRLDAEDAVERAKQVIRALSHGDCVMDETGASVLLRVLKHADEGIWTEDNYGVERAPYTGMFRLGDRAGSVIGYHEAPVGYAECTEDVEGTKCLPRPDEFPDFSDRVNDELDKYFEGSHHVRFEPVVGKDWTMVRQGQPIWQPKATPKKQWTPAEIMAHPKFKDLALLAALATVETRGRLVYADADLVTGSAAWVDLDAAPRVQLVAGSAGLCHYGNGVRCDLSRLDIEAHIRSTRASRQRT